MKTKDFNHRSVIVDALSCYQDSDPKTNDEWEVFAKWMAQDDGQLDTPTRRLWDLVSQEILEKIEFDNE